MEEFLRRSRYQRAPEFRGYRNGHLPERTIGVGMGAVEVAPAGFESALVHRYERRSQTQARLLGRLYLEGPSSGDFEPVFRALVGSTAGLSPNSILRLKQEWAQEYQLWRARPLTERYAYLFADGIYLKAWGSGRPWMRSSSKPVTSAAGTTAPSRSWTSFPAGSTPRPARRSTRCTRPPTGQSCSQQQRVAYCAQLRAQGQANAADCLERDSNDFITFYDFPQEHWSHLRTSNPIESLFAGVRLRTDATKPMRVRDNRLYLVFKLATRLSTNWRGINAPNQLYLLLAGYRFVDGQLQLAQPSPEQAAP